MLFKNLKTGNLVDASAEDTIELMQRSPIYEAVNAAEDAPAAVEETPQPKAKRTPKAKADEADKGE